MNLRFRTRAEFDSLCSEISLRLLAREIREIERDDLRRAAVMMLLLDKDSEIHVVLTKRSEHVATHKGQISFPGGVYDNKDQSILDTAYRETQEEIGIASGKINYLGRFDDYISISGFGVSCFVGSIYYPYDYKLCAMEIDSIVDAPLSMFVNKEFDKYCVYPHEGKNIKVYFYNYSGYEIWGLTARILTDFGEEICRQAN
jgi:8-oxo-dGTP pyrophosphatase MutT (NUDIX family)